MYNPVGRASKGESVPLSPLPPSPEPLQLGILENTKPNALPLMVGAAEALGRRWSIVEDAVVERKRSAAEGVSDAAFARVSQLGLVFVGSGD